MDDNVISFPQRKLPTTTAEVKANLDAIQHVYLNEVTEVLVSTLVAQMEAGGFDILREDHNKDFVFMLETVRSCLCKTCDVYHPIQDIAEEILAEIGEGSGVMAIADHINVKFRDESEDETDGTDTEAST